jgi:hypothetical protein
LVTWNSSRFVTTALGIGQGVLRRRFMGILDVIAIILVVLWLLGFSLRIAGGLIHILLVIAVILFLFRFIGKNR